MSKIPALCVGRSSRLHREISHRQCHAAAPQARQRTSQRSHVARCVWRFSIPYRHATNHALPLHGRVRPSRTPPFFQFFLSDPHLLHYCYYIFGSRASKTKGKFESNLLWSRNITLDVRPLPEVLQYRFVRQRREPLLRRAMPPTPTLPILPISKKMWRP